MYIISRRLNPLISKRLHATTTNHFRLTRDTDVADASTLPVFPLFLFFFIDPPTSFLFAATLVFFFFSSSSFPVLV